MLLTSTFIINCIFLDMVTKIIRVNFTKRFWIIRRFDGKVPNYHFSRTGLLNYQKPSHKGIPSGFSVKSRRKSSHVIFLRVKYLIGTWVLCVFKFSTSVLFCIIGGTWIRGKNTFGTSVRFFVQILTSYHVSITDIDMWHYIKKN